MYSYWKNGKGLRRFFASGIFLFLAGLLVPVISSADTLAKPGKRPLVIGVSDWAPYTGAELPGHGFLTELTSIGMKRAGYDTVIRDLPWSRILKEAQRGEVDLIPHIWYTDERNEYVAFGPVLAQNRLVLISCLDRDPEIETIADLDNLIVGTMQDYAYPEEFLAATGFKRDPTQSLEGNLMKLANGRVDAVIDDELVVRHTARMLYPEGDPFRYAKHVLEAKDLFLAISRKSPDHQKIMALFTRELEQMKADGSYDKLLEKHGLSPSVPPS
ncbi:transporter substrate-binding domain-containing protein [Kiloniella laminariae]|uniref:Transporter substrate-binding domain-containing protein n=1 Tax=Kiloniella laminariae TaxID=454162 RepID=A0ABT4LFS3_9PROT|nr:transporter substrate-binding domain-containing protein [Kiloniella laminariae]MCZ4279955.1 transporter substrate-binding domain-containing protein [Kiloniella laminariae]